MNQIAKLSTALSLPGPHGLVECVEDELGGHGGGASTQDAAGGASNASATQTQPDHTAQSTIHGITSPSFYLRLALIHVRTWEVM